MMLLEHIPVDGGQSSPAQGSNTLSRLSKMLLGKTADHCAECGLRVDPATEFRVLPGVAYCSEDHAVADQQNNPL